MQRTTKQIKTNLTSRDYISAKKIENLRQLDVCNGASEAFAKLDDATCKGEKGVIATYANIDASLNLRAALTDDNLACLDDLTTVELNAEALASSLCVLMGGRTTGFNV
jgi:hypothetical protein